MALKDWKKFRENAWSLSENPKEYPYPYLIYGRGYYDSSDKHWKSSKTIYHVILIKNNSEEILQENLTKSQALKFVKAYMRRN